MDEERKQVLIVGINYAPEVTGIAPYTTGLARYLASEGYSVGVLTSFPHYPAWRILPEHSDLSSTEFSEGVELHRLKHYIPSNPGIFGRLRMELGFGLRAVTARWGRPDLVICLSPSLVASAIVLSRVRLSRKRPQSILWVQDFYSRGVVEAVNGSGALGKLATVFESSVLSLSDRVVVIHDRFKRTACELLKAPGEKVDVVRNWTHVVPSAESTPGDRSQFGWRDDETIVLHAGNMGAKQDLENVVIAARLADERNFPVRFILLGDGNQRSKLEELAEGVSRIEFVDPLDDLGFRAALACSDILLLNEKPEVSDMAVPSKLTTYFAAGKPVMAATQEGSSAAEEVWASRAGVVVPPGEPDVLLNEVIKLSKDRAKMAELGRAGYQYQGRNLTASASLNKFLECVEDVFSKDEETVNEK